MQEKETNENSHSCICHQVYQQNAKLQSISTEGGVWFHQAMSKQLLVHHLHTLAEVSSLQLQFLPQNIPTKLVSLPILTKQFTIVLRSIYLITEIILFHLSYFADSVMTIVSPTESSMKKMCKEEQTCNPHSQS